MGKQSTEWDDAQAERDMIGLLGVRSVVLSLLEKARGDKYVFARLIATKKLTEINAETLRALWKPR